MNKLLLLAVPGAAVTALLGGVVTFMVRVRLIRSRRRRPLRCPACGGTDVRSSYPSATLDSVYARFSCLPFRCRACTYRFYRAVIPDSPG